MWSIIMEPGKKYSAVVENTLHLSMATLDLESIKKADDYHTVYVETDGKTRVIVCHLSKSAKIVQCQLNHIFPRGTNLKFFTTASANIHMTGYLDLNEDEMFSDLESDNEVEEEQVLKKSKPEKGNKPKAENDLPAEAKSIKLDESNQSNEDSDDDIDSDDELMDFEDDSDDEDETEGLSLKIFIHLKRRQYTQVLGNTGFI